VKLTIGTRGSKLALVQTNWIASELKKHHRDLDIIIKVIKTKGDMIQDIPLEKIGDKGLFVKEIENAILAGEVDFSVNSMKDMPSVLPDGLCLGPAPRCEDNRDALVTEHKIKNIGDLPKGAVIATGSKRRSAQVKNLRSDIEIIGIRGNVETRIGKMVKNSYDGVILAMAGLNRLSISSDGINIIPIGEDVIVPAPCQGILALEMRENDENVKALLAPLLDGKTQMRATIERDFLKAINGGCHAPTGAYVKISDDMITLTALFGNDEKIVKREMTVSADAHRGLGQKIANEIMRELNE
jgi:hydroxymethylbilane synthase